MPPPHFGSPAYIVAPSITPVFADARHYAVWPQDTDTKPVDLDRLDWGANGMQMVAIPRHGRVPASGLGNWPVNQPLPGAVNIAFWDFHVEKVPLERLWSLYWHRGYQPPVKPLGVK